MHFHGKIYETKTMLAAAWVCTQSITTSSSYILTNRTKDVRGWVGCSRNIHSIVYIAKAARDNRRTTEKENLDSKAYEIRKWKH